MLFRSEGFNYDDSYAHSGGGAGIGGNGALNATADSSSTGEASGDIVICSGTVIATGGASGGYRGGGGAGIGGGGAGYSSAGGNSGKINIQGGRVVATGGKSGSGGRIGEPGNGIGTGSNGGECYSDSTPNDVILSEGAIVETTGEYGVRGSSITIIGESTRLRAQGTIKALSVCPITTDIDNIVLTTDGSTWEDGGKVVEFFSGNNEYILIQTVKAAVEAAN